MKLSRRLDIPNDPKYCMHDSEIGLIDTGKKKPQISKY